MGNSDIPSKAEIMAVLETYVAYVETGKANQAKADAMLDLAVDALPHGNLSDLLYHGERERTNEEAVDEALHREHIWQTGGDLALLLYLQSQMEAALADPKTEWLGQRNAKRTLDEVTADIARIKAETLQ
jgi:hypothetical protein